MIALAATRLDDSKGVPERERSSFGHPQPCLECGTSYVPRQIGSEFCSEKCRKGWNNRRATRGAEMYDLVMALRWNRAVATGLHVFSALSRLAAGFRAEDVEKRQGRRSWSPPHLILERKPHLRGGSAGAETDQGAD